MSITIDEDLLRAIDKSVTVGRSRSRIIEDAARQYLVGRAGAAREERDLKILDAAADALNREMEDVLAGSCADWRAEPGKGLQAPGLTAPFALVEGEWVNDMNRVLDPTLYVGGDPRDIPAYRLSEAAHYLRSSNSPRLPGQAPGSCAS